MQAIETDPRAPATAEQIDCGDEDSVVRCAHRDKVNARRFSGWFSVDRQHACARIAVELKLMAERLSPDVAAPRAARRALKKRLDGLSALQLQLLSRPDVGVADIRAEAAALGLKLH